MLQRFFDPKLLCRTIFEEASEEDEAFFARVTVLGEPGYWCAL